MPDPTHAHHVCEPAKPAVRARVLAARRSLSAQVRAAADELLLGALSALVRPAPGPGDHRGVGVPTVAAYVPLPDEPGGADLPATLAGAVLPGRLILPLLRPDADLDWAEYTGPQSLRPARFGLLEPAGPALGPGAVAAADLVVVPALAVDATGVRLGRGGGSYDRALARVGPGTPTVVPLYPGELVPRLPSEPHDRRVTAALVVEGGAVRTVRFTRS